MLLDQLPTCTPKCKDYIPLNMGGSHQLRGNLLWIHRMFSKFSELGTGSCLFHIFEALRKTSYLKQQQNMIENDKIGGYL